MHAIELPPVGGDTLWSCQYAAYEALSPGMRALINPVYTQWFDGMTEAESRPLLQYLFDHAINDYDGSRRLLHRTTVAGDRPVGPSPGT